MSLVGKRVFSILVCCICLHLCIYGMARQQDDDGDNGIEMVEILEPITWCDVEYVKVCKWWDTLVEAKIYACRSVPRTVCVTGFQKITLVFALETEDERKQRIAKGVDKFVTSIAREIKKLCDAQASSSEDTANEDEEETDRKSISDARCLVIENYWDVLTHKVLSVGHKHLQGAFESDYTDDVLGEWDPLTSGSNRWVRIWLDVTEHEKNFVDDDERDEEVVMSLLHERAHSSDWLKDGIENIDDSEAEAIAWEIHQVIGHTEVNWEPQRIRLLEVLPGWNHEEEDYERDNE